MIILLVYRQENGNKLQKSKNQKIAEAYLEQKGYKTLSYRGRKKAYRLTKKIIASSPHSWIWAFQEVQPDSYIGKMIEFESFIVKNHRLDDWRFRNGNWYQKILSFLGIAKFVGSTTVSVIMVDGKAIGGTSTPVAKEKDRRKGELYLLDGREFEDVSSDDYLKWHDEWVNKYKE